MCDRTCCTPQTVGMEAERPTDAGDETRPPIVSENTCGPVRDSRGASRVVFRRRTSKAARTAPLSEADHEVEPPKSELPACRREQDFCRRPCDGDMLPRGAYCGATDGAAGGMRAEDMRMAEAVPSMVGSLIA